MAAPPKNQNAKSLEPADSWLQVRVTRRRKAAYVRAAHPRPLSEWITDHLDQAAGYKATNANPRPHS